MIPENKLKKYRKISSLTQEELSKSSGISIRTIQRIEKGLSIGSSHTIRTLAKSLNIKNTDLLSEETSSDLFKKADMSKVKLMNFSILTMLLLPFGNIIFPYIIFFRNKKENENVNTSGRKILSFQILSIIILPFLMIFISLYFGHGGGRIPIGIGYSYILYALANVIISIRTAIEINEEKEILKFVPNIL